MRITFVTRKFGKVERNSHCDALHITPVRVARLVLGCNGVFAIKAYIHVSYRRRIPATLIWPRQSLGSSCQSTEMATLLDSIYFVFTFSFLPKYRVVYYDYTVKWCSLINYNWCVWLDIVYILALTIHGQYDILRL